MTTHVGTYLWSAPGWEPIADVASGAWLDPACGAVAPLWAGLVALLNEGLGGPDGAQLLARLLALRG